MGLRYAKGPYRESTGIPSSAFSKGDVLVYNSASSLSRMSDLGQDGAIIGVAKADSLESLDNLVPFVVALPGTVFWSDATAGGQFDGGDKRDLERTSANFIVHTSTNTPLVVIDHDGMSQEMITGSAVSQVLCMFDTNAMLFSA